MQISGLLCLGIELTESGSGTKQSLEPPSASRESDSAFSDTPSPQPDDKRSTNPFADSAGVSTNPFAPVPPCRLTRRSSSEMEDLTSDFLVKTTLTKAKSMVCVSYVHWAVCKGVSSVY